jgi:hypothetical protein
MKKFDEKVFQGDGIKKEIYLECGAGNSIIIETYLIGLDISGERVLVDSKRFDSLDLEALAYYNSVIVD